MKKLLVNSSICLLVLGSFAACEKKEETPEKEKEVPKVVTTITSDFTNDDGLDAISVDAEGQLFVSNFGAWTGTGGSGTEIYEISPLGEKCIFVDGLSQPGGNTFDAQGNLYVSSSGIIYKIDTAGNKSEFTKLAGSGLTADPNGNIYNANYTGTTVYKVAPDGTQKLIVNDPLINGTVGIAYVENQDVLYAANFNNGNVLKISMDGNIELITNIGEKIGYICEMNGALYATLIDSGRIAKISFDGELEIVAGSGVREHADGSLLEAGFINPNGITADPANNILYVSEYSNPRVSKIQL